MVRVSFIDGKDMLSPKLDVEPPAMHPPEGWDEYVPQFARFTDAYRLTKRQLGAFYGTDLDLQLRRRGIDTVTLCGVSTWSQPKHKSLWSVMLPQTFAFCWLFGDFVWCGMIAGYFDKDIHLRRE